jgi:hypothetical protein
MGIGRQDPGACIGGTTGIAGVDHGDGDPARRKLVGQREADQPAPGNGNVTVLSAHDRAG